MARKYWERLFVEWRGQNRDGLTIPFIIGSQQYFTNTETHQSINDLIVDIADNDLIEVYITYCLTVNEIILGLRDKSKERIAGSFPLFRGEPQSRLFLSSFPLGLGEDIETISKRLTEKFQGYIDAKQFSVNNREWGGYNGDDLKFIRSCAHLS